MRNMLIAITFVFLSACSKTKIVAPNPEIKPSIYNTWFYDSDSIVVDSFYFNGGNVLTPFKMTVKSDSIFRVFSDKSTLIMYTYKVTKDSLYLHSFTVSAKQHYTFTKHN